MSVLDHPYLAAIIYGYATETNGELYEIIMYEYAENAYARVATIMRLIIPRPWVISYLIPTICKTRGHNLETVKHIAKYFQILPEELQASEALYCACAGGCLETVQWLVDESKQTSLGGIKTRACIIYISLEHNNPDIADWLFSHFRPTAIEARVTEMTGIAFRRERLDIAQWMADKFGRVLPHGQGACLLSEACKLGRLDLTQWLTETYSLTPYDARVANNYILRTACELGHLRLAQWLVAYFRLNSEDIRDEYNSALHHACKNGKINVVNWILQTFDITRVDIAEASIASAANQSPEELTRISQTLQSAYNTAMFKNKRA